MNCVWKLHYEMVIFYFVITFLVYQLFDNVGILHYIKIILRHYINTLYIYCSIFESNMEIMLQSRYICVHQSGKFLKAS